MQARLSQVARWLLRRFPRPPEGYEPGRDELRRALARHLGCSADGAAKLLDELERAGYVRYAAEARAVGGSAGEWIIYAEPEVNPADDEPEDLAVPDDDSSRPGTEPP